MMDSSIDSCQFMLNIVLNFIIIMFRNSRSLYSLSYPEVPLGVALLLSARCKNLSMSRKRSRDIILLASLLTKSGHHAILQ